MALQLLQVEVVVQAVVALEPDKHNQPEVLEVLTLAVVAVEVLLTPMVALVDRELYLQNTFRQAL
jgi:hypothetical protein